MVELGEMFWLRNEMMVLPLKSWITFILRRPDPLPRFSTATRTSAARRPLSCRASAKTGLLAANPCFINFYLAVQRLPSYIDHLPAELVQQHPSGLITGQTQVPLHKQGRNPTLVGGHQISSP